MELKLKNSLIKDWRGYKGRPFLISGPCSAETEEQVMETAEKSETGNGSAGWYGSSE